MNKYSGFAFLTERNTNLYFNSLELQSCGDEKKYFSSIENIKRISKNKASIFNVFFVLLIIYFYSICTQSEFYDSNFILSLVCFLFYTIFFLLDLHKGNYSLIDKVNNKRADIKLAEEAYKLKTQIEKNYLAKETKIKTEIQKENNLKRKEKQQGIKVECDGNFFVLFTSEILVYEYFRFIANEGKNIFEFKKPNKDNIIKKFSENWGVDTKYTIPKFISKSEQNNFSFLIYKNSDKNILLLKAVSNILNYRGFINSSIELKNYYRTRGLKILLLIYFRRFQFSG